MRPDMVSKLAEEKLSSREQHFRALIENSSDAIALFARWNCRFRYRRHHQTVNRDRNILLFNQIPGNEPTKLLPLVVFTPSSEEENLINSNHLVRNSYVRKPVDFDQFTEATRQLGLYWLILNQMPSVE